MSHSQRHAPAPASSGSVPKLGTHDAAVSAPAKEHVLPVDVESTKPSSQVGRHDNPGASDAVQVPASPFAGAVLASHGALQPESTKSEPPPAAHAAVGPPPVELWPAAHETEHSPALIPSLPTSTHPETSYPAWDEGTVHTSGEQMSAVRGDASDPAVLWKPCAHAEMRESNADVHVTVAPVAAFATGAQGAQLAGDSQSSAAGHPSAVAAFRSAMDSVDHGF